MDATAKLETTTEKLMATVAKLTKMNEKLMEQVKHLHVGSVNNNTNNSSNKKQAEVDKNDFKLNEYFRTYL